MPHVAPAPPPTPVEPITETLHGIQITDPYRWLEDQNSPLTRKWLVEQAACTRGYFDEIPERERIRERVQELLTVKESVSDLWNVGERYFFMRRPDNREQCVIYGRDGLSGPERILIDPAERATGKATAVGIVAVSEDGRFLAYSVRQGGTDHAAIEILDLEHDCVLPDRLPEGFCTGLVFAPDGSGFYYSHRGLDDPRPHYRAAFHHRFGTEREQDQEILFAGEEPNLFLGIFHSREAKLLGYAVLSTGVVRRTSIYLQDFQSDNGGPRLLLQNIEGCFVPFFVDGQLLSYTDVAAPNFRIVRIDLANPSPSHWRDVVSESDRRIQQFSVAAGRIFITRIDRFSTTVDAFDREGKRSGGFTFPPHSTIEFLNRTTSSSKLVYSHTSISTPAAVFCYDPCSKQELAWNKPALGLNLPRVAIEESEYRSKDGTTVPIILAAREDLLHSGPLPTFLTGYGGFGSCVTPRFTAFATFLMEQGCLFAVPALRGGSELGEQWHEAGIGARRQNSFDDFIAAADWLIATGHSRPERIAIGGGSNAGLLAGAVLTQRPDLFRAVLCLGPLLDMVRYHLFDFAARWADEYGSPDEEQDFRALLGYSPYHNVKVGTKYPAVMLISGDADTRCNPMHARKMAALLQAASGSDHPILLDYKPVWGHMPVQPLSTKIEALTDRLAFVCRELNVSLQGRSGR